MNIDKTVLKQMLICFIGFFFYASGVTVVKVCLLGISPITSTPYVISLICGLSLGTCTMIVNVFFFIIQRLVLKKEYTFKKFLGQFILSTIYAGMIDFTSLLFGWIVPHIYIIRILYLLFGCFVLAFGVTLVMIADFGILPGEGVVVCIQRVLNKPFGTSKVIFDCSMVIIAAIISLICVGYVEGVREGTLISALTIGFFSSIISKFISKHINRFIYCN